MIWPDKAFLAVYFLVIIIVQCIWQARLFKANKPISHFWHAVYYLLTAVVMIRFFEPWWAVMVIAVVERLALFGPILNAARGKRPILTYNGKGTTGSWQNQIENNLSDFWIAVLKLFYVAVFATVLILL